MTIAIPAEIKYGRVRMTLIQAVLDSADADDLPDGIPAEGEVTFTATLNIIDADTVNIMIAPGPFVIPLTNGSIDLKLVATDTELEAWGYKVDFNIIGLTIPSVTIAVPTNSDQFLNEFIPAGILNGTYTARGPQGPAGPVGPTGPANTNADLLSSGTVPDLRLPGRLRAASNTITNANLATGPGWYSGGVNAGDLNFPTATTWYIIRVEKHDTQATNTYVVQTAMAFQTMGSADTKTYQRTANMVAGAVTWSAWYRIRGSEAELDIRYKNVGQLIDNTELPTRLREASSAITDWNTAVTTGWYEGANTALNAPTANYYVGIVSNSGNWITQDIWDISTAAEDTNHYRRHRTNAGTWGAWLRLWTTQAELDGRYKNVGEAVADNELPGRLQAVPLDISDWNLATETGFYRNSVATAANAPTATFYMGFVEATPTRVTQTVHAYTADSSADTQVWRRDSSSGVWTAWYRLRWSEAELDARYKNVGEAVSDAELGRVGGRNLIDDASAVRYAGSSGWLTSGGGAFTISESARLFGTAGLLITPGAGTYSGVAVSPSPNVIAPGEKVVLSVWVRSAVARNLDFNSDQLTGATATVDGVASATGVGAVPIPANNVWVRVVVRGTVAASQNKVDWYFRTNNVASTAQFTISEPTIQRGVVPTDEPGIAWRQADARYIASGDTGWLNPGLENGWVAYSVDYYGVQYRKIGGQVFLRGMVKNGTIGARIFQLPAGYRLAKHQHFPIVSIDLFAICYIQNDGSVVPTLGNNGWVSLHGISFFAD